MNPARKPLTNAALIAALIFAWSPAGCRSGAQSTAGLFSEDGGKDADAGGTGIDAGGGDAGKSDGDERSAKDGGMDAGRDSGAGGDTGGAGTDASSRPDEAPCEGHCGNGVRDCGEEGIDCGAECAACAARSDLSIRGRWLGMTGGDGRWRVAIPTGQLDMTPDDVLDRMESSGKSIIKITVGAGGYGLDSLWLYNGSDFRAGFDQEAWNRIAGFLDAARDRDIGVILGLWGTVALEGERPDGENIGVRWDSNPWNARVGAGGPYDLPGCGKEAFYTFHEYGGFVYSDEEPFPEEADMFTRGQWRQEEIVHHISMLARDHPNAALMLMWEADDGGSHQWGDCDVTEEKVDSWHAHMSSFIKSLSPSTLVSTGVDYVTWYTGLDFITAQVGDPPDVNRYCNAGLREYPVVSTGWAVSEIEDCCEAGCSAEAYAGLAGYIRNGWLCGLQVGAPFWEYRPGTCYPSGYTDQYLASLSGFFEGIESWEDEPGAEIAEATLP